MGSPILPPIGQDLRQWGRQLTSYLQRNLYKLGFRTDEDNPSENGISLWDDVNEDPIVSYDNEFRQIVMAGAHATFIRSTDLTAAAANTAYSITYDASPSAVRVDRDATNPERIVFSEGGNYKVSFTAQISSSSSSTVNFYFWPSVNGTAATGSTMINSLHQNGATLVVSRSAIFSVNAGDYLEVKWAVDSTSGFLNATSATAFAPAAPATTLTIVRVHV